MSGAGEEELCSKYILLLLNKKRLIICMYYGFILDWEEEGGGVSCRFVVYVIKGVKYITL